MQTDRMILTLLIYIAEERIDRLGGSSHRRGEKRENENCSLQFTNSHSRYFVIFGFFCFIVSYHFNWELKYELHIICSVALKMLPKKNPVF